MQYTDWATHTWPRSPGSGLWCSVLYGFPLLTSQIQWWWICESTKLIKNNQRVSLESYKVWLRQKGHVGLSQEVSSMAPSGEVGPPREVTCPPLGNGQGPCPSLGSDLPSPGKWSGTMPLSGKWPAFPWEVVWASLPCEGSHFAGVGITSKVRAATCQVWASFPSWGHTSCIGSYLQFPKEGQNAPPGAVILNITYFYLNAKREEGKRSIQ